MTIINSALSIFEENVAYYDSNVKKIIYHFSKKKVTIPVEENVDCIQITDTHIYFILNGKLFRGILDQTPKGPGFKLIEPFKNKDEKASNVLYLYKGNKNFLVVVSNLKHVVYFNGSDWIDISPREENIKDELPPFDFTKTSTLLINMLTYAYYGIFEDGKMQYKKIAVPEDHMIHVALSEKSVFYLNLSLNEKTEIRKMEFSNSGVFEKLFSEYSEKNIVFAKLHSFENTLYILSLKCLFIFSKDKPISMICLKKYITEKEDEGFFFMSAHKDNLLIQSCRGSIVRVKMDGDNFQIYQIKK